MTIQEKKLLKTQNTNINKTSLNRWVEKLLNVLNYFLITQLFVLKNKITLANSLGHIML